MAGRPNAYSLSLMMTGFSRSGQFYESSRLWAQLRAQGWVDTVRVRVRIRVGVGVGVRVRR